MDSIDFYRSFHKNPINKFIHAIFIPLIVLCVLNFLYAFENRNMQKNSIITQQRVVCGFIVAYLYNYGIKIAFIMAIYLEILAMFGIYWKEYDDNWLMNSGKLFVIGWIMQFLGHWVEGNRPALTQSLSQAIFQAPLYTLEYYYPPLFR